MNQSVISCLVQTVVSCPEGKVICCSDLFKNFPQFVLIHIVKGFSEVSETEVDVVLELLCFFYDTVNVGDLICGSSAFSKSNCFLKTIRTIIMLQIRNILGNHVAIKLEINNKIRKQHNNILSQENS